MVDLAEHSYYSGMVDSGNEYGKKIGQQCWLLLKIESQRLVVTVQGRERDFLQVLVVHTSRRSLPVQ